MAKILISLLIFFQLILLVLDGIAAGICFWLVSRGFSGPEPAMHSAKAMAYFMIASGLTLSMICSTCGIILTVLSFIFKSWKRAFISIFIALAAIALWRFFLGQPYTL